MIENPSNLELSDEKFRILFELSPLEMAMIDYETGKFLEVNQSLLNSVKYTKEEFLSLSFYDVTPKEYDQLEKQQIKDLEATGKFGPNKKNISKKMEQDTQ